LRANLGLGDAGARARRLPVGASKVGRIARSRRPELNNALLQDPEFLDQDWAHREGLVAFAGYPLLVGDQVVGVLALFSRQPFSQTMLDTLATVANTIALVIIHKQDEEARRQAQERAEQYLDLAGVILVALDTAGRVMLINRRGEEILGGARAEILGRDWFERFVPPDQRPAVRAGFARLMAGDIPPVEHCENAVLTCTGEQRLIAWHNTVLRDADHRIIGTLSSGEDVTALRGAAAAQMESEAKYRALIEATGTGYVILDEAGRVVDANAEYVRLTGRAALTDVMGHSVVEWTAPHDRERNTAEVRQCLARGFVRGLEVDYMDAAGRTTPMEINATVLATPAGTRIVTLCRDITARRRAEVARRESDTKYRRLMETAWNAILVIDVESGFIVDANRRAETLTGLPHRELIGRRYCELMPAEDETHCREQFTAHARAGGGLCAGIRIRHRDGHDVPVEISSSAIEINGRQTMQCVFRAVGEPVAPGVPWPAASADPLRQQVLRGRQAVDTARDAARRWFADARYGLFLHYGLYSLLGRGEWVMFHEKIPVAEYARLKDRFTADKFDARAIADLAVAAGMKYVTLTARHHDGFCLFRTTATDFSSVAAPAKRDLVAELADACRARDLGLFLYYSYALDWRHPYFFPRSPRCPLARPDYPAPDPAYQWQTEADFTRYLEFVHHQLRELLSQYGPLAGLWFDPIMPYYLRHELFPIHDTYALIRTLQPRCLIAFKQGATGDEDFAAPEHTAKSLEQRVRESGGDAQAVAIARAAWEKNRAKHNEICATLHPAWGYKECPDSDHKQPVEVLDLLAKAAGANCNLLLNTGPLPDGSIQPMDAATLRTVGEHLRAHGFPAA
jgi:alpha-L-fucosidase